MSDGPAFTSGVSTELSFTAQTESPRSECGIGALLPWADELWAFTYPSHGPGRGDGHGLYAIDEDWNTEKRADVVRTCANRMVHTQSDQAIIGPHVIDADGDVRTFEFQTGLDGTPPRLTATMEHLDDPEEWVYFLGMEGGLYEGNVHTLETQRIADLNEELDIEDGPASTHFKDGHTARGRVIVGNNSYDEAEYSGERADGLLAEWDGEEWTVIERSPHNAVTGRRNFGEVVFATGWDRRSALLHVLTDSGWERYRLPKGSKTWDHMFQTEWPRIREVETERYLMDCHGQFYDLSPLAYGDEIWGVQPISRHLRIVPDFTAFRGTLVMAGNQTTPLGENETHVGQPQSGLWVGKTDDVWDWGKPGGWGGPWREDAVTGGEPSDPYLMTGFDRKSLHLSHDEDETVTFEVEIDFLGDRTWESYATIEVGPDGYEHHEFPQGFDAHWVRLVADHDCTASAQFRYT